MPPKLLHSLSMSMARTHCLGEQIPPLLNIGGREWGTSTKFARGSRVKLDGCDLGNETKESRKSSSDGEFPEHQTHVKENRRLQVKHGQNARGSFEYSESELLPYKNL